jgi:hypothetical protein
MIIIITIIKSLANTTQEVPVYLTFFFITDDSYLYTLCHIQTVNRLFVFFTIVKLTLTLARAKHIGLFVTLLVAKKKGFITLTPATHFRMSAVFIILLFH